jgi:anti-sigma regulatory factor (Ser/Thr protein kinase)
MSSPASLLVARAPPERPAAPLSLEVSTLEISTMEDAAVAAAAARAFAAGAGLGSRQCVEVALVASELATNLVRHGGGRGMLELRAEDAWLELRALDRGPGMREPERLWMGRSDPSRPPPPGHSLGEGGASIRRLSDEVWVGNRACGGLEVRARKRRPPEA